MVAAQGADHYPVALIVLLFKSRLEIYLPNPSYTYTHTYPALRSNLLINNRFHTASADPSSEGARSHGTGGL